MESSSPIHTPIVEQLEMKKEDIGELVNPIYFKGIIRSLRYLTSTRLDIVYGLEIISRFMEKPYQSHLQAAKQILRYVNGTRDHEIFHFYSNNFNLVGCIYNDWGGDVETIKSTVGYVFIFIFYLRIETFSWSSKKQQVVALSTIEDEYMAITSVACQVVWLHRMLSELKYEQKGLTNILCDNESTIALTKNPMFHGRRKHISITFHYIRELVKNQEIELEFRRSEDQVANIFTKPLKMDVFEKLKMMLGVTDFTIQIKGGC